VKATTVKETLIAARWILDNVGWCQGTLYKDKYGNHLSFANTITVSACAIGAVFAVDIDDTNNSHDKALDLLLEMQLDDSVNLAMWNDKKGRTKQEVLKLFDRAIEKVG
jgi:hypothetical protein